MPARRGNVWYLKRQIPGFNKVRKSLGTSSAARARTLEGMIMSLADRGRLDVVKAWLDDRVSLAEITEAYETGRLDELTRGLSQVDVCLAEAVRSALKAKHADVASSTLTRYGEGLDHFSAHVGASTLIGEALTTQNVREFKAQRLSAGVAKETINNDLGSVSILCTHAIEQGWIARRPDIKRYKGIVRIRYLEPDQMRLYMAHLRGPFRVLMQLLVGTGMRLGEAESLHVRDINLGDDATRIGIRESKTAAGVRHVFVPGWVAESLRDHVQAEALGSSDNLFTIPRRTVQKEHKRACSLAGIHHYTIHDHRHTAAVHLARAGMPLHLLQRQLGHKHISTTMRYAAFHPEYSDVKTYFDRVEERFGLSAGPSLGHTSMEAAESQEVKSV